MHEAALQCLPELVSDAQLDLLRSAPYKLEVVLGRLWGTIGPDALDCLFALRLAVPNEAHMLAALHLIRGGTHATVNFDVGIECAHDLLTRRARLPPGTSRDYHQALARWRRLIPADPPPLLAISGKDEFAGWLHGGRAPALLKVHGGLSRDQTELVDVVVVDIEELGQLITERRAALDRLADADRLLITGYSGADPDVYQPLLAVANRVTTTWCCYQLSADSTVPGDAAAHNIRLVLGAPQGLAVTALRDLLGTPAPPPWPDTPLATDRYQNRFDQWASWLRGRHSAERITQSWAWLLADLGDLDAAEAIFNRLDRSDLGVRIRHAEILYSRARSDDRVRAKRLLREIAGSAGADAGTRLHCRLRLGDIARGRALRQAGGVSVALALLEAFGRPLHVILATRNGRRYPEEAGDAYRALQQTSLRVLERLASAAPRSVWPALGLACRAAARLGDRAATHASNGNRLALVQQHRALLLSLAALLNGRPAPEQLRAGIDSLRNTYRNADDLPGAANCAVTLAVLAAADGDVAQARALLDEALAGYAAGRPDGRPLPSGEALVSVISTLMDRLDRAGH